MMRGRFLLAMLASSILVAGLPGCASVNATGDPGVGGLFKRTVDVAATTVAGVASKNSDIRDVWQDSDGTWHWTKTDKSGGISQCEGPKVGMAKQCDAT